ncbi:MULTISPECIES: D-amino acid dehydrogenase [unclassified Methylobacterium]|uniref:D-amino acid dehydrogenase n=1 Tax=unclassified Methylobacterium TaxID=2615210 RepID=UPI0011C1F937|nr:MULTISPECIES: D-amino acid dehydrogenase [unclassified Methylobacterium]QEE38885.1 D-amino acid dehydrogenase [Methylobacterium sp. WL1]TXN53559.1 D-amino acid dehydrogenase [Methylobacterium sp. WL2]
MTHIAIIGAGITGVTTAYALARRGYDVTVLDRQRYAAMETSFANGGQLSACNAEVWNKLSTVLHGVQWMMRRDAPLLMNPAPSWHKLSWMAEFMREIAHYRQNTVETVRLALKARTALFAMAEAEGIDFDLKTRGILHFYRDRASFEKAHAVNALLREGGLERDAVTPEEMRAIEPTLAGSYAGGFFTPSDATGDIHKFTRGLAAACARRGVRFVHDASVETIAAGAGGYAIGWRRTDQLADRPAGAPQALRADAVVICAGCASRRFAAMLGDRVNVYPVKGYSITVNLLTPEAQAAAPEVSILDEAAKIVTSRLGDERLRVAGTAEFNGFNRDIRHDRVQPLIDWTREQFPLVDTDRVVAWSGLRPMLPNMLPKVGRGRRPGVFYNTGHGHLGWTLSGATAELVAEAVAAEHAPEAAGLPLAA